MLCDRVLYNLLDTPCADAREEDPLPLHWRDVHARAIRGISRAGRRVDLLLPLGSSPCEGDVVYEDERTRIVVRYIPVEVYVVRAATPGVMALIAAELGNLHIPLQVVDDTLLTPCDGPAAAVLQWYGIEPQTEQRRFKPLRAIALADTTVSPRLTITRRPG